MALQGQSITPPSQSYLRPDPNHQASIMAAPEPEPYQINGNWVAIDIALAILFFVIWLTPTIPEDNDNDKPY